MNRSPFARSAPSRPIPKRGRQRLGREPGRDGVDELGPLDAREQQVDPVGVARRRRRRPARRPSWPRAATRRPAVVGEVVEGHEDRRAADDRIVGVADVADRSPPDRCASRGDAGRRRGRPSSAQRLEGRPAEQAEPPRRCRRSRRRRRRRSPRDRRRPGGRRGAAGSRRRGRRGWSPSLLPVRAPGIGHADRPRIARPSPGPARRDSAAGTRRPGGSSVVAARLAERPGERVDDVGQTAGLGPRFAFGGEHRDAHRHGPHRTRRRIGVGPVPQRGVADT